MPNDWNVKAVVMDHVIKSGCMPLCPLCDSEMLDWMEVGLVMAYGDVALAHADCIERYADDGREAG